MHHNFILTGCDTDSIMVCKPDFSPFSKNEQENLLNELNSLYPELIKWDDDGYYECVIVLKAKNYVLWDGKTKKVKGSALKDGKKEVALKEFLNKIIDSIIEERYNYTEIYNSYVKEIMNVTDIKRWASRKTLTDKIFNAERLNEQKVKDAIEDTEYVEGDRVWTFFKEDESLELVENFNGDYNKDRLLRKLYNTAKVFESIMPVKELFLNYGLKRNKELLKEII